jgi:release factor glutamine methyltransferase
VKPNSVPSYRPRLSAEQQARLRKWHDAAYEGMRSRLPLRASYLGREVYVPEDVFPPTPISELLGKAALEEVRPSDRVLDMGTGSGVNAILAASMSRDLAGVDVNPRAVASAIANAERNGVATRTTFLQSDVFGAVEGTFDLIVFDPPSRWFAPRDLLEASIADEN